MVKPIWLERVCNHIRSSRGMVSVELAIGLATLTFVFIAALSALGVLLVQLNLIDVAHNAARMAARGQATQAPANIELIEQYSQGSIYVQANREIKFWLRPISLTAVAKVVVE